MSPVSIAEYYSKLDMKSNDYFGNYLRGRQWGVNKEWQQVGKKPDRQRWLMNPQEVNAYYNPVFNEIVFPAGILQSPFFSDNYPEYLNYGGIGAVVGHELSHGFDNMGRHFDAHGRLVEWWTNATSQSFDEKADCFVKQYSNYTVPGDVHVNGRLTLGENVADNGGIRQSFSAWKATYDEGKNPLLPGLDDLTREQLFFVNFGRIWCHKATDQQAKQSVSIAWPLPSRSSMRKTWNF